MFISGLKVGDVVVLDVRAARVDAAVVPEFLRTIAEIMGDARKVVLDLSQISFVDSSGLGALIAVRRLVGSDGRLTIVGLQPPVATLLRLTRLDKVFPIFPTVSAALATNG